MSLLDIHGMTVKKHGQAIINQLDLALESGEVHALLGSNGTGKSTLAYAIMGCHGYQIEEGEIIFAGKSLRPLGIAERARLGISMAWQEPVRFEGLSVARYLSLGTPVRGGEEALTMVGLDPGHYMARQVDDSLSGGERKRIELASLLTLPLQLAILDEPDSGIDMLSTLGIIGVINVFRNDGTCVLLITHREEIARIADRASQICGGKILRTGTPREVADRYLGRRCRICDGSECHDEHI